MCDRPAAEVTLTREGLPKKWGAASAGFRVAELRMLDGSYSTHTVCSECTLVPAVLPLLWARACLLYVKERGRASTEDLERFIQNIPIGVEEIRPDDRIPMKIETGAA